MHCNSLNYRKSLNERTIECRENGYLLSGKMRTGISQYYKLGNDLRSKNHNMVAIKILSISEAPLEYSKRFVHREIYALNAMYRHLVVVSVVRVQTPNTFLL
uniref:Uncharacterized protein n=1 Tax=Hucho hucho TaxID=62062 RepID=A0A4W5KTT1_9TELE